MDHFTHNIIRNELRALTAFPPPGPEQWAFSVRNDRLFSTASPSSPISEKHGNAFNNPITPEDWVKRGSQMMKTALAQAIWCYPPKKHPLLLPFFQFLSCVPILYHMFSILLPIFLTPRMFSPSDFVSDYPCVRTTTVRRTWYIHVPASAGRVVSPQKYFLSNSSLVFCFFSPFAFSLGRAELALYTTFCNDLSPPCFVFPTWHGLIDTYIHFCVCCAVSRFSNFFSSFSIEFSESWLYLSITQFYIPHRHTTSTHTQHLHPLFLQLVREPRVKLHSFLFSTLVYRCVYKCVTTY